MKNDTLLRVEDLTIGFSHRRQITPVVDQVSFTLVEGEILGIVGESGSGKTMSALAIMGLLPKSAQIMEGKIYFSDQEIISASAAELRELKGTRMAMIFQEPMTTFNPVLMIGAQVEEMLRLHEKCSPSEYQKRTIAILKEVGLEEAETIYQKYPHQLSGGMRQRAMIAMAMIAGPKLLISDEPTTALDITIQKKILRLLKKINQTHGTAILLVSHDLGVIKSFCNRALVMKDGKIVETGRAKELFINPQTDYTKKLVAAAPVTWMKQQEMKNMNRAVVEPERSMHKFDDENQLSRISGLANENQLGRISELEKENQKIRNWKETSTDTIQENILVVENLNVYYQERSQGIFLGKSLKHVVKNLQQQYQLSYLFISHDLNVIYQVCDRICVMYQGEIVETRNTRDLFFDPQHDYSKVLLEASIPD